MDGEVLGVAVLGEVRVTGMTDAEVRFMASIEEQIEEGEAR